MKIDNKKILRVLATAVLITVVSYISHTVWSFVSMGYYLMEEYYPVWSKIMMPEPGPPPMSFTFYSIGFGFIGSVLFTVGYLLVKKSMPGKDMTRKGLLYGLFVFFVGAVPGYLAMVLLVNLPLMLVVLWAFEGLLLQLISGVIVARMNK